MNDVSVWVTDQALPAPLHEVISALTHSVCQGHTPPLGSGADFEGSQPCPESLALSSRCFSSSFQEMSIGFPPPLPSPGSLLFIETRPQMPQQHWDGCSVQILFPLPTCYIFCCLFWVLGWYIPRKTKYTYTSRVPGLTEHLLPTFAGVLGNPFAQSSVTVWGWWVNEWNQSMEPTQQLLALLLQFQSIQGKCKPTEKPSPWSWVCTQQKDWCWRAFVQSLKQVRLMFAESVYPTWLCSQLFFSHLFVSHVPSASSCLSSAHTDIPKGHFKLFFNLSKFLFNYQQTAQYIPLLWRCFLPQPSLLRQKTFQVYLSPFEGEQNDKEIPCIPI